VKWFRFYHEVLEDIKVQGLDGDTFKRWVNVLCLASQQEPRGSIPNEPHAIAFRLHIRLDAARRFLEDMQNRGLLEQHPTISGRLVPHNWEKRQQSSDDSAPRVAKSRGVSPEKNRVNVTATPPLLKRRLSSIDGERDTETVANATVAPKGAERKRTDAEVALHRAVWETLRAGISEVRTKPAASLRAAKCWELVDAGYSPERIRVALTAWSAHYPDIALTDAA
jgi:hypothetical protein